MPIGIASVQTAIEYEYDEIRCEARSCDQVCSMQRKNPDPCNLHGSGLVTVNLACLGSHGFIGATSWGRSCLS